MLKPPKSNAKPRSLLFWFLLQLRWLILGVPKPNREGTWVYNTKDKTWRYYVVKYSYE